MKIGITGAGSIGSTIARRLSRHGHDVKIANSRGPETMRKHDVHGSNARLEQSSRAFCL